MECPSRAHHDAVFERVRGDGPRFLVVGWKSGRPVVRRQAGQVAYFVTQLRLYRRAWAARVDIRGGCNGRLPGGALASCLEAWKGMIAGRKFPWMRRLKEVLHP